MKKMTKAKAEKRLKNYRESLEFWREKYVANERKVNLILDIQRSLSGKTLREEIREECIENINEAKRCIARAERIAL